MHSSTSSDCDGSSISRRAIHTVCGMNSCLGGMSCAVDHADTQHVTHIMIAFAYALLFWYSGAASAASGAPVLGLLGTQGQASGLAAMMGKLPRIYIYPNSEIFRNASAGYVNMYRWGRQSLLKG